MKVLNGQVLAVQSSYEASRNKPVCISYLHSLKRARDMAMNPRFAWLKPTALFANDDFFGVTLNVTIDLRFPNKNKSKLFFDHWHDECHRYELGYAMLEYAQYANSQQYYIQGLWEPDRWLWVENEAGGKPVFTSLFTILPKGGDGLLPLHQSTAIVVDTKAIRR